MVSVNFNFVYRPNEVPLGCFIYKIRYNVYATQKLQWRRFLTTPDMHIFILRDMDVPLSVALQSPIENFVYVLYMGFQELHLKTHTIYCTKWTCMKNKVARCTAIYSFDLHSIISWIYDTTNLYFLHPSVLMYTVVQLIYMLTLSLSVVYHRSYTMENHLKTKDSWTDTGINSSSS